MARMPQKTPSGSTQKHGWIRSGSIKTLTLSAIFFSGLLGPKASHAFDSFRIQEIQSSTLSGHFVDPETLPFNRIELDLEEIAVLKRSQVSVKFWKDRRLFRQAAVFKVQAPPPGSLLPHRLVHRDKGIQIVLEVYPQESRLGRVEYLEERSIQVVLREFWNWIGDHFPSGAVADEKAPAEPVFARSQSN
jgi:hypothetical protein